MDGALEMDGYYDLHRNAPLLPECVLLSKNKNQLLALNPDESHGWIVCVESVAGGLEWLLGDGILCGADPFEAE